MCYLSGNEVSRVECNISCGCTRALWRGTFSSLLWELMHLQMQTKPLELYCVALCSKQETN